MVLFRECSRTPHGVGLILCSLAMQACGQRPLLLGNDILWKVDGETDTTASWAGDAASWPGDAASWFGDTATGMYVLSPDTQVAVSSEHAHSGQHSIRIANRAGGTDGGGGLFREMEFPKEAFYSAWYYVPKPYKTVTGWLVMRFAVRRDEATVFTTLGLTLFSRPGGNLELRINDYRPEHLQAPLADPPPIVPVGKWFHLEAFFRNVADETGRMTVWLDGIRRYDLQRPMGSAPILYFAACGETNQLDPSDAEIFLDDIAVSHSRVAPQGMIEAPR